MIAAVLAVVGGLYFVEQVPNTLLFWAAFVLIRPLGATVGDYFTKPTIKGGLGLGTYGASAVLLAIPVGGIVWLTVREVKSRRARDLSPTEEVPALVADLSPACQSEGARPQPRVGASLKVGSATVR